jgi:hypothetical protein
VKRRTVPRICATCGGPFEARTDSSLGVAKYCSLRCSANREKPEDRFARQVDTNGPIPAHRPELGPCHVWTGHRDDRGYGVVRFAGKQRKAHRVAFFLANGRWPEPCGLHKCDGGEIGCVRLDHLFEGTIKDNVDDMIAKGRAKSPPVVRGEQHGSVKLTDAQVAELVQRRAAGESQRAVARHFGVSQGLVSMICSGKRRVYRGRELQSEAVAS